MNNRTCKPGLETQVASFSIGDVVCLKGSPTHTMTVLHCDTDCCEPTVETAWFDLRGEMHAEEFPAAALAAWAGDESPF